MTSSMIMSVIDNERMDRTHPRADGPRRRRAFTAADKLAHLVAYEQACEHERGRGRQDGQGGSAQRLALVQRGRRRQGARLHEAAVRCFAQDALDRIEVSARRLLAAVEEGDMLRTYLAALKRFTKRETLDTVALRRQVAEAAISAGGYPL